MTQPNNEAIPSDWARKLNITWLVVVVFNLCVELAPLFVLHTKQTANATAAVVIGLMMGVAGFGLIHQFTAKGREWARWIFFLLLGSLTGNALRDVIEVLMGVPSPIELLWLIQLILQATLVFQTLPKALGGVPLSAPKNVTEYSAQPPEALGEPVQYPESTVRSCVSCGSELVKSAAFCSSCGRPTNASDLRTRPNNNTDNHATTTASGASKATSKSSFASSSAMRWIAACLIIVAAIVADHKAGPLLPSEVYCLVGAGHTLYIPAETKANGWTMSNNCDARRPECANSWISTPARSECIHTTIWDGYRSRFKL